MTVRGALAVFLPWFLFLASAPSAGAQEWHEAYRDGLKALAQTRGPWASSNTRSASVPSPDAMS